MNKIKNLGKDYWKYWIASAESMAASEILQYVLALYVMDLTGSATMFASMLSIILFPRLLLTPFAGVVSDRTSRIKVMSLVLFGEAAVLTGFFAISMTISLNVVLIFALVTILEVGEVFYRASESAIIPKLVDKEKLAEAIPMQMSGSILLQTGVDEKYLGRVTSVIGLVTSIAIAAGELLFGLLDDFINAPLTIFVGAIGVAVGSFIFESRSSAEQQMAA